VTRNCAEIRVQLEERRLLNSILYRTPQFGCLARANAPVGASDGSRWWKRSDATGTVWQLYAPRQGRWRGLRSVVLDGLPAPLPGRALMRRCNRWRRVPLHHRLPSVAPTGASNPHEQWEFLESRRSAAKDPEVLCEEFTPARVPDSIAVLRPSHPHTHPRDSGGSG
jgi:hypothetical protein